MLGKKSGGLKPGSKASSKCGNDMDKWGMSRNRNMFGGPERTFLDRDVCTGVLLPITLEELLSGPIPEKEIGDWKIWALSHSSFFRCTQYQIFGTNRDFKEHFQC